MLTGPDITRPSRGRDLIFETETGVLPPRPRPEGACANCIAYVNVLIICEAVYYVFLSYRAYINYCTVNLDYCSSHTYLIFLRCPDKVSPDKMPLWLLKHALAAKDVDDTICSRTGDWRWTRRAIVQVDSINAVHL